jgi:hypothetical protein
MKRRKDVVDPDGIAIMIPFSRLVLGDSVFIPCVNTKECAAQLHESAEVWQIGITTRVRVEHDILGVRFWRTT